MTAPAPLTRKLLPVHIKLIEKQTRNASVRMLLMAQPENHRWINAIETISRWSLQDTIEHAELILTRQSPLPAVMRNIVMLKIDAFVLAGDITYTPPPQPSEDEK